MYIYEKSTITETYSIDYDAEAALTVVLILLPPVAKALATVKRLALGNG